MKRTSPHPRPCLPTKNTLRSCLGVILFCIIARPIIAQNYPQYWVMDKHIGMKFYADSVGYFRYDSLIIPGMDFPEDWNFVTENLCNLTVDSTRFFTAGGNQMLDWEGIPIENGILDSVEYLPNYSETNCTLLLLNEDSTKAFWINGQTAWKNYYLQENLKYVGLKYSLVDLNANGGHGKVIESKKETYLYRNWIEERLMAIRKADGINWWVIAIRRGLSDFLVLETKNDSLLIHDSIADPNLGWDFLPNYGQGEWDYLPNHQLIVLPTKDKVFQFFHFNPCNGSISYSHSIEYSGPSNDIYGISTSKNENYLYFTTLTDMAVFQIDLTDNSTIIPAIPIILTDTVANNNLPQYPRMAAQLQKGPDGKIYFGLSVFGIVFSGPYAWTPRRCEIAVINEPNMPFPLCDVNPHLFPDTIWNLGAGFPNLPVDIPWQGISGAAITAQPTSGCVPLEVQFTSDACGHTGQEWNFGDGTATSGLERPLHTYAQPGTYFVSCTLTHPWAAQPLVLMDTVRVEDCIAVSYSAQQDTGCHHVTVQFQGNIVGNAQWHHWDFGDGNTDTLPNPFHQFVQPGTYTITYSAGNAEHTDTQLQTLTIPDCGPIFQIHPNPSPSGPYLSYYLPEGTHGEYQVYDVLGKFLYKGDLQTGYQSHLAIPFPVAGGTYYLRAEISDGRRIVEKLVVMGE